MTEKIKKAGYEAPKMEATSFVTEKGYAMSGGGGGGGASGASGATQTFNKIDIIFQP